jgi:hypothetical protein
MKLTQKSVSALTLPAGKSEAIYFDTLVPGLGLRLRVGGAGRWIFQYRVGARHRRITLGSVSAISLAQARASAGKLHAGVKLGGDPAGAKAEERARAAETMGAILEPYLARQRARLRPRSLVEVERHLMKHSKPLHGLRLDKIDRRAVAARITAIANKSGAIAANRARASLAAFFVWAIKEGLVDQNPVAGTNRQAERSRDRVLSLDEIRTIWNALGDDDYGIAVKLLMLTGQRASEIGSASPARNAPPRWRSGSRIQSARRPSAQSMVELQGSARQAIACERRDTRGMVPSRFEAIHNHPPD